MPVVLTATMWVLLVNTVNSTGQWYFPRKKAHAKPVRERAKGQGQERRQNPVSRLTTETQRDNELLKPPAPIPVGNS